MFWKHAKRFSAKSLRNILQKYWKLFCKNTEWCSAKKIEDYVEKLQILCKNSGTWYLIGSIFTRWMRGKDFVFFFHNAFIWFIFNLIWFFYGLRNYWTYLYLLLSIAIFGMWLRFQLAKLSFRCLSNQITPTLFLTVIMMCYFTFCSKNALQGFPFERQRHYNR